MATRGPTSGRDILLLFLYVPGVTGEENEPISGRTRLMKMMFIFERELYKKFRFDQMIEESDLPDFSPWLYGPFSKDVFDYVEFFRRIGFVEVTETPEDEAPVEDAEEYGQWVAEMALSEDADQSDYSDYTEESFRLTDRGMGFVRESGLFDDLSENQRSALKEYKSRFNRASLYAILQYVYKNYPQMTAESQIKERILR